MNDLQQNMDSVSGIVDSIIYANDENGYTVCEIEDTEGQPVVVTGIIPYLTEGDKITVWGQWTNHQTYGRQFKAESFEKKLPAEQGDILRYLASGAVKGIGPKTAQKIVETFGTDSFDVLENHPDWLTDLPGVTQKRAAKMSENFKAISGARAVMMFCRDFFTPQTAMKIYKKWGGAAVDRIKNNPYRLCEDFWGISFSRADQIAMSMGQPHDSEERIIHGAVYVLRTEASRSGHTCLPYADLYRCTLDLLFGGDEQYAPVLSAGLDKAITTLALIPVTRGGVQYICEPRLYRAETYTAEKLRSIDRLCPSMSTHDMTLLIQKCEAQSGITYANAQRQALLSALSSGVMVLTGGPGTGKTTIIKGLLSIFSSLDLDIALCAPTGRAAKRMSEATSHEAKTIHRLLEMDFADESGSKFLRDEHNLLDADVLIVDEASMIDISLMESLLRALKNGARLVLIGDADQLPSVGAGNVLGDIIASGIFTVIRLTEIFRQSEASLIISNAHRINDGVLPVLDRKDADFFYLPRDTEEGISSTVVDLVRNRLPRSYGAAILDRLQILTPSRKGFSGTDTLNQALQDALNPPAPQKKERKSRDRIFRTGDRIMQTKNNYTVEWETDDGKTGMGVYNGDIGIVEDIDTEENLMTVRFDEKKCVLDFTQLDEIDHAYAITVHKSQGSEYPVVIIPLYGCAPMLLTRNLLYTAVTRASSMVILVGRRNILEQMVANGQHTHRCTLLSDFLKNNQS
ncbi:MAG: ATP-dependent RecD-like DNA helicase [Clostridia bacterium]|nr:ATP-dependent RecD-like DNA helicase [Clostridia bacterium]